MMNKPLILAVALAAGILSGCNFPSRTDVEKHREGVKVKVVSKKKPKHFRLTVEDIKTGARYHYSRKRCSNHTKYEVGDVINVTVVTSEVTIKDTKGVVTVRESKSLVGIC